MVKTIRKRTPRAKIPESMALQDSECYEFNPQLSVKFDDGICEHCRKYFTVECPSIDDFLEDEEIEE